MGEREKVVRQCCECGREVPAAVGFCSHACLLAYSQRPGIPAHLRYRGVVGAPTPDGGSPNG